MICLNDGIAFHLGARLVAAVLGDDLQERRRGRPFAVRTSRARSGTSRRGTTRTRSPVGDRSSTPSPPGARAPRAAAPRPHRVVRPTVAFELGEPRLEDPTRSRMPAAIGPALVVTIPVAHRDVAAGQAGHVAPAARGQLRRGRPAVARRADRLRRPPRPAPRRATSGRWEIAATASSCSVASSARGRAPDGPRKGLDTLDGRLVGASGRRPTAGPRTGPAVRRRSRSSRDPPSGGRRRTAARARSRAPRSPTFVLATSVITASWRERRPPRAGQLVELREADRRGAGEDDEVGAVDGGLGAWLPPRRSSPSRAAVGGPVTRSATRRDAGDRRRRRATLAECAGDGSADQTRTRGARSASARVSQPAGPAGGLRRRARSAVRPRCAVDRRSAARAPSSAGRARRAGSSGVAARAVRVAAARGSGTPRTAGSAAPPRTATRAARPYRSGDHTTSRRDAARW